MSFYPINPDTTVESFIITNVDTQKAYLGRVYNINELVPINYTKVALACLTGALPEYAPLREIVHISETKIRDEFNEEVVRNIQGGNLRKAFQNLLSYWETDLLGVPPLQCPLGVVTEITTQVVQNNDGPEFFNVINTFKVVWYVIPGSLYS